MHKHNKDGQRLDIQAATLPGGICAGAGDDGSGAHGLSFLICLRGSPGDHGVHHEKPACNSEHDDPQMLLSFKASALLNARFSVAVSQLHIIMPGAATDVRRWRLPYIGFGFRIWWFRVLA